jgi:phosphoglycolate phosphatase
MKYRAVLFDLDGTLLDSLQDIAGSVNSVLAGFGFPSHDAATYKLYVSNGIEEMLVRVLPEGQRDRATAAKVLERVGEEYSHRWAKNTRPYPGVPEMLDSLTDFGIKMAVLSNTPQVFAEMMVARLLPVWDFEFVVGAQAGVPKKPDPAAALCIARMMDIPPREFLYLGDSDVDMKTAAAAGMYPVGAVWGFRTAGELLSGGARALARQPGELLNYLYSTPRVDAAMAVNS